MDRSWPKQEGKIAPESIEFTDFEISSFFWSIYTNFWQACLISISPAPVLLLELRKALRVIFDWHIWSRFPLRLYYSWSLERLYESCEIIMRGGEALSRAEPPAGPPKFTKVSIFHHFFEKFVPFATFPRDRFYACNPQISTIYKLTASDWRILSPRHVVQPENHETLEKRRLCDKNSNENTQKTVANHKNWTI